MAGGQTDQIQCSASSKSLIPPYQTSVGIAPRAKIFNVQIADAEYARCSVSLGAHFRPHLHPAVESRTQERE